jgi:predicted dehydrogenase
MDLAAAVTHSNRAEVVAICDVDARVLAKAQHEIGSEQSSRPVIITQHEQLVTRDNLDAILVATPDHWHARMGADVLLAGKDLFLETPVAHTIQEGESLCQLAGETEQVVQVSLPQRSGVHFQSAVKLIRSGFLGKIHLAKAWAVHRRKSIGHCAETQPPLGVDYDRWLGPAPLTSFQLNRFHHHWPWFWDYGSGELGLWGVQHLDVVRWALDLNLPKSVIATGGKRSFYDDRETPDTLMVHYDFDDVEVVWEHRQWSNRGIEGRSSGAAFYGDLGTLVVDRSGWKVYDHHEERHANASEIKQSQVTNFLESVRTRATPIASLNDGQNSSILCHLGNIASRLEREITFDPHSKTFGTDTAANELLVAKGRELKN